MHLDYEITPQDLAAQRRYLTVTVPSWRRWVEGIGIGAACGLILVWVQRRSEFGLHVPSVIGGAVAVSMALIILQKLRLRQLQPLAKGFIYGPKRAEIGLEGILLTGSGYETKLSWKAIRRIDETGQHVFLVVDRAAAFTLPKRAFVDEATKAAFVAELRKHEAVNNL